MIIDLSGHSLIPDDTERLSFRKLTLEDVPVWEEFILSDDAMKYFTFPRKREESMNWIQRQLERYKNHSGGLMAVVDKDKGTLYGQCGLLIQELEEQKVLEVGYSFLPQYWGKGYASEAAAAFFKYAFEHELSERVLSVIHVDNVASQNVAKRNGLTILKTTVWKGLPVDVWGINHANISGFKPRDIRN